MSKVIDVYEKIILHLFLFTCRRLVQKETEIVIIRLSFYKYHHCKVETAFK
jgi:hypothetical protein